MSHHPFSDLYGDRGNRNGLVFRKRHANVVCASANFDAAIFLEYRMSVGMGRITIDYERAMPERQGQEVDLHIVGRGFTFGPFRNGLLAQSIDKTERFLLISREINESFEGRWCHCSVYQIDSGAKIDNRKAISTKQIIEATGNATFGWIKRPTG
jgi:hypothetical protein